MNINSVKTRFIVSLAANVGRAGVSFFAGVLTARALSPIGYGDLFFLLGSFTAIRALMDMGTSQAFYTFIAQSSKQGVFYWVYFTWLALQFMVIVVLVLVALPDDMIDRIWLEQSRDVILLAFLASFMQQKVWTTIIQICEAVRMTVLVQLSGLAVVLVHLALVNLFIWYGILSIQTVLYLVLGEYVFASLFIWWVLTFYQNQPRREELEQPLKLSKVLSQYWVFCRPLIIVALAAFAYEFIDRWLLQRFGGSEQQGFYQISAQFAAVSLLATASVLSIFWKEIAEAYKQENHVRVSLLYHKVSRSLVMLGAIVACFLVPWAEQLTMLMLGDAYLNAWPILAIMFLYPVHQSLGQINGAMFMACERTGPYMKLSLFGMVISMPVTYFMLVPSGEWFISGLGLGALGLALKMVGLNVLMVNLQAYMLARYHGWKYDWWYQIEGVLALLILGFSLKFICVFVAGDLLIAAEALELVLFMLGTGVAYLFGVIIYVWVRPSLFGLERQDLKTALSFIANKIKRNYAV